MTNHMTWELDFVMWQIVLFCYNYHKYFHITLIPNFRFESVFYP